MKSDYYSRRYKDKGFDELNNIIGNLDNDGDARLGAIQELERRGKKTKEHSKIETHLLKDLRQTVSDRSSNSFSGPLIKGAVIFISVIVGFILLYKMSQLIHNSTFSKLERITHKTELNILVNRARNERGAYILNKVYWIESSSPVMYSTMVIKDNAISRPKGSVFKPRFSDISAPFKLIKQPNNDSIFLYIALDTLILKLEPRN